LGLGDVPLDARAFFVEIADAVLRWRKPLLGGEFVPSGGLSQIRFHAAPFRIAASDFKERFRIAFSRRFAQGVRLYFRRNLRYLKRGRTGGVINICVRQSIGGKSRRRYLRGRQRLGSLGVFVRIRQDFHRSLRLGGGVGTWILLGLAAGDPRRRTGLRRDRKSVV